MCRKLGLLSVLVGCLAIALALPTVAKAQCLHGVAIAKSCLGPGGTPIATVGQTVTCTIQVSNNDSCGDAIQINSIVDVVHHTAGDTSTGNLLAAPVTLVSQGNST